MIWIFHMFVTEIGCHSVCNRFLTQNMFHLFKDREQLALLLLQISNTGVRPHWSVVCEICLFVFESSTVIWRPLKCIWCWDSFYYYRQVVILLTRIEWVRSLWKLNLYFKWFSTSKTGFSPQNLPHSWKWHCFLCQEREKKPLDSETSKEKN